MEIFTREINIPTKSHNSIHDITPQVAEELGMTGLQEGQVCVSAIGSTAGISTLEFEPGLVNHDVENMMKLIAPYQKGYEHNKTWGDDNGAAHLRSFLTGTSFNVPFKEGKMLLGTWQQIVLVNFDTGSRDRKVAVQIWGK